MTKIGNTVDGFYLEGNDTFVDVYQQGDYSQTQKYKIDQISKERTEEGTYFQFQLSGEGDFSFIEHIVLKSDGTVYNGFIDGGAESPYKSVSEDVFYLRAKFEEESGQPTPDSSETITTPEPEKSENTFEGTYWVTYTKSGKSGVYFDGNENGTIAYGGKIMQGKYKVISQSAISNGTQYVIKLVNEFTYVLGNEGKLDGVICTNHTIQFL